MQIRVPGGAQLDLTVALDSGALARGPLASGLLGKTSLTYQVHFRSQVAQRAALRVPVHGMQLRCLRHGAAAACKASCMWVATDCPCMADGSSACCATSVQVMGRSLSVADELAEHQSQVPFLVG